MLSRYRSLIRKILTFYKTQTIVAVFLFLILTGALLLTTPAASKSGEGTSFIDALFTATSATCVTGLVVVDTYQHFTLFGQIIIIALIQVGGLGFMTMATLFSLIVRRTISFNERLLIQETLNMENTQGIVKLTKHILIGTFAIESIGALLLSFRFVPQFGFASGVYKSIFHAVSAFCNAGFDIMGQDKPFINLMGYVEDPIVNITIMLLIITGGIGFAVWEDLINYRRKKNLSLHSKIVLSMTGFLILGGALAFFALEHDNPGTMGPLSFGGKVLASFFQSITLRTAGFNTINLAQLTDSSKIITILLMFIGAAPGSTGGGIKVVTAFAILAAVVAVIRGTNQVVAYRRKISLNAVLRAVAITIISITVVVTGVIIISLTNDSNFMDILFEVVSAFGTVGLSLGLTTQIGTVAKLTLIIIMYFGRVGVLTAALAFVSGMNSGSPDKVKYPEEKIMVG